MYCVGVVLPGVQYCKLSVRRTHCSGTCSRSKQRLPSPAQVDADNARRLPSSVVPACLYNEPSLIRRVPLCVQPNTHHPWTVCLPIPYVNILLQHSGAHRSHYVDYQHRAVLATFYQ